MTSFPSLTRLHAAHYSGELKSDWRLVEKTDAGWKYAQITAQFKIIPNFEDHRAAGYFPFPFSLFSVNAGALRQDADKTI